MLNGASVRFSGKKKIRSNQNAAGRGGKGVNVARWLRHLGGKRQLLLPLGGETGAELAGYLRAEKLSAKIVSLCEPTRVNVVVTTAAGQQLRFNPAGPTLSRAEWSEVLKLVERSLAPARLLILSGSLPRGVPATAYAQLIRLARRFGVKTLLDCDGEALAAAVKARPFLVKPNEHELAQWRGRPLRSESAVVAAARILAGKTGGWVLVSRGAQRSLLLNKNAQLFFAEPPRVTPLNRVGAGDALLAAVARQIELGAPPRDWLRWGIAAGGAATQCAAGGLPRRRLVEAMLAQIRVGSAAV